MDSNSVPVTRTLSVWISWKDIPTLSKHRKYIPLSYQNPLLNPKSFPCRNEQNQVFIKYFFLINILVQLTFFYFVFSNIFLIRNGHKFYAAVKKSKSPGCYSGLWFLVCMLHHTNSRKKKLDKDSSFISRLIKNGRFLHIKYY